VVLCILQGYIVLKFYDKVIWKTPLYQVQEAIRGSGGDRASISEGVEASVIYVRFKAAASEVSVSLLFEINFQMRRFITDNNKTLRSILTNRLLSTISLSDFCTPINCNFFSLNRCLKKLKAGLQGKNMVKSL